VPAASPVSVKEVPAGWAMRFAALGVKPALAPRCTL
jgi:hypothetical protein